MEFGYIEKYKLGCEKVENGLYKEMVIKAKEIQTELRGWFSCVKLCFDDVGVEYITYEGDWIKHSFYEKIKKIGVTTSDDRPIVLLYPDHIENNIEKCYIDQIFNADDIFMEVSGNLQELEIFSGYSKVIERYKTYLKYKYGLVIEDGRLRTCESGDTIIGNDNNFNYSSWHKSEFKNKYQFCKFDGKEKTILRPKDFNKLETLIQWFLNTRENLQPPVFDEREV